MKPAKREQEVVQALASVDRLVHEPARLAVLTYLSLVESADFVFLMRASRLTWGNLSSHLAKLEQAGYVAVEKGFVRKKPRTTIRLTAAGRDALHTYRATMRKALRAPAPYGEPPVAANAESVDS